MAAMGSSVVGSRWSVVRNVIVSVRPGTLVLPPRGEAEPAGYSNSVTNATVWPPSNSLGSAWRVTLEPCGVKHAKSNPIMALSLPGQNNSQLLRSGLFGYFG